ncbi:hypothetical protein DAI22_06g230603 [Oryza sativa Japonica Group]|nr:hypothetical protein DAI22_06g230603 [Oryza sativa Japonica Group]
MASSSSSSSEFGGLEELYQLLLQSTCCTLLISTDNGRIKYLLGSLFFHETMTIHYIDSQIFSKMEHNRSKQIGKDNGICLIF